jgi:iron complex outermembrane receptor protein
LVGNGIFKDLNGNGNATDSAALVYGSSVTETNRPGVTLKANTRWANNDILAGYWYEQARHVQTGPRELLNASGQAADPWLFNSDSYILQQNGQPYMARNWLTISTASSLFVQDTISLMDDKLSVQAGLRNAEIKRDFTNYANGSTPALITTPNGNADYNINKTYSKLLPSLGLRYRLDGERQVFANIAQNMKAPGNFSYQNLATGGIWNNGVLSGVTLRNPTVDMETSTNLDVGYRVARDAWTFSGSLYYVDFSNRIASAYVPEANSSIDTNVGNVITQGFEVESGYKLSSNWSVYGSLSYTSSKMQSNLITGKTTFEATQGKQMPDTPEWLSGLRIAYNSANWYGNVDLKYTGAAYSTLVNDETMGDYATVNVTTGYRFADSTFFKKPSIQMNVMNLFDTNSLRISSPSGSSFTTRAQANANGAGSTPAYYVSAPLYLSVTLRSDF